MKAREEDPNPAAGLPEVHHVGLIVGDCGTSAALLAKAAGGRAMTPFDGTYSRIAVEGVRRSFSLRFCFVWVGNMLIELLQPLDAVSPHAEFLQHRGEGLHHLGFRVTDFGFQTDRLEGLGLRRLVEYSDPLGSPQWTYLGESLNGGLIIELMAKSGREHVAFFSRVNEALGLPLDTSS